MWSENRFLIFNPSSPAGFQVVSMRGTYMASQLSVDNSIHSVISFDLGGEWQPLSKPVDVKCKDDSEVGFHTWGSIALEEVKVSAAVGCVLGGGGGRDSSSV